VEKKKNEGDHITEEESTIWDKLFSSKKGKNKQNVNTVTMNEENSNLNEGNITNEIKSDDTIIQNEDKMDKKTTTIEEDEKSVNPNLHDVKPLL